VEIPLEIGDYHGALIGGLKAKPRNDSCPPPHAITAAPFIGTCTGDAFSRAWRRWCWRLIDRQANYGFATPDGGDGGARGAVDPVSLTSLTTSANFAIGGSGGP